MGIRGYQLNIPGVLLGAGRGEDVGVGISGWEHWGEDVGMGTLN